MNRKSNQNSQNQEYPDWEQDNNDQEDGFTLPAPDRDNVTALTDHLPNNPILPWHHYDSPWEDEQEDNHDDEANPPYDEQP